MIPRIESTEIISKAVAEVNIIHDRKLTYYLGQNTSASQ